MRTGFQVTKIYWMKNSGLFRIQMLWKDKISVKDFPHSHGATKWVSVGTGAWEVSSSVEFFLPFRRSCKYYEKKYNRIMGSSFDWGENYDIFL